MSKNKRGLPWKISPQQEPAVEEQREVLAQSHGLFAHVPIICHGGRCPYAKTCMVDPADRLPGERCPTEIAFILNRFKEYCTALGLSPDKEEDVVDMGLVRELVDIEIQLMRADSLMAIDATPIKDVIAVLAEDGTAYYKPELHRAVELKTTLRKTRHNILSLLNSTRKDRNAGKLMDPSSLAASLIERAKELEKQGALKGAGEQ